MKAFFGFVIRWVIPLLGLIALSLIIWFVGPLLEMLVPEGRRWALIVLIFAVWIAYRVFRLIQARRQAARVLQSLAAETPPDPASVATAEELATLRQRMAEALALLKKAKLGGDERRNLYELPWYVIIGPPGSGKTTALVNSGLHFPLAAQFGAGAIRGVGGTRNCDWWFTDQAVLLDTAGRYTTQDSHAQVDKAAWLGFLDLLKTQRSRRPIDGAFIAISLSDLLLSTDAERAAHATAIRARIQELYTQLGVRFPIYLMLTKLDLVPGFMEFFDALSKEERAQVWGMTFDLDDGKNAEGPLVRFRDEFAGLEQRLNARLVERLQQERDPARRDLIYGFPQQFGALKACLQDFLDGVFKPNAYEDRALLRGVYFTSGTQEGSPIDRLIGAMAQSMNLDRQQLARQSGTGRSYFIEKLFTAVAFAERGLVGVNPKVEQRRKWLARGVLAATMAVVLVVGTLWWVSFRANEAYIAQVDQKVAPLGQSVQNLSPAQRDVLAVLPLLNAVKHLAGDAPGWAEGLGLYQGDMLEAESASVYRKLLIAVFAPRLLTRVEEQLHSGGNSDFLYEGLKAYLMLADNEHYDPQFIKAWIALDWDRSLPRDLPPEQRVALGEHLQALFERRPPNARLDERLIDDLRRQLQQLPVAQRVYDRVKRQKLPEGVPDFRLNEAAGRDAALVFSRKSGKPLGDPLSGFFTAKGYRQAFLLASLNQANTVAEEQWVLGRDAAEQQNVASLAADVRRLYFQDYLRQWDALLADIDFVPITSVAQASDVLRVLSGPTSPLKKLLVAVSKETDLQQEERLLAAQGKPVAGNVDQLKQRLGSLLGQEQAAGNSAAPVETQDPVSAHFAELNALVNKGEGEPAAIDALLADLNALYVQVSAMSGASGDALLGEAKNQASAAATRVSLNAERQPPLVQGLVKSVVSSTTNSMMGGVRNQLNAAWTSEVVNVYRQSLSGRYPLAPGSARDATLEDFGLFFGVGGVMDNYFRKYLQPYVDTSATPWRWQPGAAQKLGIAPGVLQTFQRAAAIRDAFFRSGGTQPTVRFELKPVAMDASITQFQLELDGQQVGYDHGPSRPVAMQWPNPGSVGVVRLSITPPSSSGRSGITLDGPWAWFRLLEQSDLVAGNSPDRFNLRLRVDGASISYELRASSAFNPFKSRVLSGFSLPERL
ncbi:type VI secretion system membrane subunit TssM [Pseudomonas batumici]|uniref:IcmF-related protein n=1 Tax=Pseudomonas batumici TaxID=226910 RepID=A0A0C2ER70_9PSED|nr:type VI secretion system membrane subunit TssM [Pseudomonas batumici]KIH81103.1 IcmF-related protein [Pseudomonas batumici]